MTLEELAGMLEETGFPFAYDHFAEGESPDPYHCPWMLTGSRRIFMRTVLRTM